MTTIAHPELEGLERYKFGWADSDVAGGGTQFAIRVAGPNCALWMSAPCTAVMSRL